LCALLLITGWGTNQAQSSAPLVGADTATPTLIPGAGGIAGVAWHDANGDGSRDEGEPPLADMSITLTTPGDVPVGTVATGADGNYRFAGLIPGAYRISASPPPAHRMTTLDRLNVIVGAGVFVPLDFGAQFVPSPTPTATPIPVLDISRAEFATCGSVIRGDTSQGENRVRQYACRPAWDESGPEWVYRLELGRSQPVTATLLNAAGDLDLFLLPSIYPETCLTAGDTYLTHNVSPGIYFLVVDGYRGAAGAFDLRVECPLAPQASVTPTRTPSPTPTVTPTFTPGPTRTPTPTPRPQRAYLPLIFRIYPSTPPETATITFQQGADGYAGTTDTTLSSWEPTRNLGNEPVVRLRYDRSAGTAMTPLIRFDLALLPGEAVVVQATLKLYAAAPPRYDLRGEAHALLRPWSEPSATWEQATAAAPWAVAGAMGSGVDYRQDASDNQAIDVASRGYDFDVTGLVRRWVQDPARNYGLLLLAQAGQGNANTEVGFASRDHETLTLRPQLSVSYYMPAGAMGR
jgi:hypothetical protein